MGRVRSVDRSSRSRRRWSRQATWTATVLGAALLASFVLAGAGPAAATHLPTKVARCTYEVGTVSGHLEYTTADPTGLTDDGYVNQGGCLWEFAATAQAPPSSAIEGQVPVDGEYSSFQLAVVDDVFGPALGANACLDVDNDRICGEDDEGEVSFAFCGTSPVIEPEIDSDGNGHQDLGSNLMVFLNGPHHQVTNCDPSANPYGGTTGGVLDPAGGLFLTLSG